MSTAEFQKMTASLAAPNAREKGGAVPLLPSVDRVTILGAGKDAQAIACQCLSEGAQVTMFSAYGSELEPLKAAGAVNVRGDGPVGNYQIDQEAVPSIRLTSELDGALAEAQVIFVTGPVLKQRTYSMVLAGHLRDGQILVLAPGRSLGAVEMEWYLRVGGNAARVSIVEPQALPWWVEKQGSTLHLSARGEAATGILPGGNQQVLTALKPYLPNSKAKTNVIQSGFADGSGLVDVPALMLGGPGMQPGGPELPVGAKPLDEQITFRNLLGANHLAVIQSLAEERRTVAARWGIRDLPSDEEWLQVHAGAASGSGARTVPSAEQAHALVRCAVIGSLVPLVSAAELADVSVPATRAMITLACSVLGGDLLNAGRRLDTIGLATKDLDGARRALETIAGGGA